MAAAKTIVYVGPSLSLVTARSILRAEYRPPVRKGDIYAVLTSGVRRIVVIDGIFHGAPSVWQRELLAAIADGIEVLGASSMGALRAAELHPFGMIGIGTVFEWFRTGVLDGDDEVALHHAPAELGYRALSEPLVNIRATLAAAARAGVLAAPAAEALVARMKATYYPQRTYRAVLDAAGADRAALADYLASHAIDIKAADARAVLAHCAASPIPVARPTAADPCAAEFRHVALRYRAAITTRPDRRAIDRATIDWCICDLARRRGLTASPIAVAAAALTHSERAELAAQRGLLAAVRARGPAALGLAWDRPAAMTVARRIGGVRAADAAIVAGWLAEHGLICPRTRRDASHARWKIKGTLGLARSRFAAALADQIATAWLLETGLTAFGPRVDLVSAAILARSA